MDEGVAVLIAGLAGMAGALGGAVAGAIGAVRGARIGAEKTAETTRQQVKDQAMVEHGHWLRQQRQAAYSAFIAATQEVEAAADAAMVSTPGSQSQTKRDALREEIHKLNDASSQVTVLGPESMIEAAGRVFHGLMRLQAALSAGDLVAEFTQNHQDRIDEAWDMFVEARQFFQDSARRVLVQPSPAG
jgi:hypothetical protein